MKYLIAGNWKMNTNTAEGAALIAGIEEGIAADSSLLERCDFLVCPPALYIEDAKSNSQNTLYGAQDCSAQDSGAYTGEIAASMLKDKGCSHVIVGHSERREYHAETNEIVAAKAAKAHENGLAAIICVGEKEEERDAGTHESVVEKQLKGSIPADASAQNTVIAYEPVWAIGTGKTASAEDASAMHDFIRGKLNGLISDPDNVRILYGGSLKPGNAKDLLSQPNINGGLIGGASLNADDFLAIAKAA